MRITFYGVRGSIATPGAGTVRYGGNTSCVRIENSTNETIILDAGTGIRLLGKELGGTSQPIYLFLSHLHWDHTQGFPFFDPVYSSDADIYVISGHGSQESLTLTMQFSDPFFPVCASALPSRMHAIDVTEIDHLIPGVKISTLPINHQPVGGSAYFFESEGKRLAYITDNELFPPTDVETTYAEWVEKCKGLDCLIHDATYTDEEIEDCVGWGHSSVSQALQLGLDAEVKILVLFHHAPDRTDDELDALVEECQRKAGNAMKVIAAREGETLVL